jgi:ATP-dependent exoDNAse (exonuclease V) alpha subunit
VPSTTAIATPNGDIAQANNLLAAAITAQLAIVDEASLVGTFVVDELVAAVRGARTKVVLVGDQGQLSAIAAGGMFAVW